MMQLSKQKVDYSLVESILQEAGIAFSKPTPGHYRIENCSEKVVYFPKSHSISVNESMQVLSYRGSARSEQSYRSDAENLLKLVQANA